jgi:hypothetical protein
MLKGSWAPVILATWRLISGGSWFEASLGQKKKEREIRTFLDKQERREFITIKSCPARSSDRDLLD